VRLHLRILEHPIFEQSRLQFWLEYLGIWLPVRPRLFRLILIAYAPTFYLLSNQQPRQKKIFMRHRRKIVAVWG
jgi:hypothetical protein